MMIIGKCSPYYKIYKGQQGCCRWCQRPFPAKSLNRDHVLPASKGYPILRYREEDRTIRLANVVLACEKCNSLKSNRTLEEFEQLIIRKKGKGNFKYWVRMLESVQRARAEGIEEQHLKALETARHAKDVRNIDELRRSKYGKKPKTRSQANSASHVDVQVQTEEKPPHNVCNSVRKAPLG